MLNSFDQSSLLATGSITESVSWEDVGVVILVGLVASASGFMGVSAWVGARSVSSGVLGFEGDSIGGCVVGNNEDSLRLVGLCFGDSFVAGFGLKKPLSVCWPGAEAAGVWALDFDRLTIGGGSLFSVRLRVTPFDALFSAAVIEVDSVPLAASSGGTGVSFP